MYHVRASKGTEVRVCKKAFCDVHSIRRKRVSKLGTGELTVSDDQGKQLDVDLSALAWLDHTGVNPKKVEDLQKMFPYIIALTLET